MALSDAEKLQWLQLIRSERVGPKTFWELLRVFGSAEKAILMAPELSRRGGNAKGITIYPKAKAEKELEQIRLFGAQMVAKPDPSFPTLLRQIEDCPPLVAVHGNAELLSRPMVALVGSRNASSLGMQFSKQLAGDLGRAKIISVSGLARGIDTAVHTGALEAGTIGVIAGGIDHIYPRENERLFHALRERGAVVTEMPFGAVPKAEHFPRRNRIISGMALGTVVVEATLRSGSLITARMANEQGREVFAVPGFPTDPRASGPIHLLKQGAHPIESAKDILDTLRLELQRWNGGGSQCADAFEEKMGAPFDVKNVHEIETERERVFGLLSATPMQIDALAEETGLPIGMLLTIVLELELAGRVIRHPGNRIGRA